MSIDQIDGAAVVTLYFEDRITSAQAEVEDARAALADAEAKVARRQAERDRFVRDGALHAPAFNADSGRPEWALCQWALSRVSRAAFKDRSPAGDAAYKKLQDEQAAAHAWLNEHGYTVPEPFRGQL